LRKRPRRNGAPTVLRATAAVDLSIHYPGPHPFAPGELVQEYPLEILCIEMGISKPMKPMTLHSRPLLPMRNSFLAVILIIAMGLLSACGGGSGSGNGADPPPAALTISTSSLPAGQTGVAYGAVLAATGGTPPYTWSLTSGTFPAGLMLNAATGAITGTPTQAVTNTALTFQVAPAHPQVAGPSS